MSKQDYAVCAEKFTQYIQEIAKDPEKLEGMENYLSRHFGEWMKKFARTPADITYEFQGFAGM